MFAALIVVAVDSWVLGMNGPWEEFMELIPRGRVEKELAYDQLAMRTVREAMPERLGVFLLGSSRAQSGFQMQFADAATRQEVAFGKITHAAVGPFGIRSVSDELLGIGPDAIVIFASEFDTHRPVWITPQVSFGSFSAIWDLATEAGVKFSFNHRVALYRLTAACVLKSYRYRDVLAVSVLNRFRRFELDERFGKPRDAEGQYFRAGRVLGGQEMRERNELYRKMVARFPEDSAKYRTEFRQLYSISRGSHSQIQENLLRRTVERFRHAGIQVVLAETPLHPIAPEIYDVTIREDFLRFASHLEDEFGVRFIPLEESGPYVLEDFNDLTHLMNTGSAKLSRAVIRSLQEVLELDPSVSGIGE